MTRKCKRQKNSFYLSSFKTQIDLFFSKNKKFYLPCFYQLKIGHDAIGTFFKRLEWQRPPCSSDMKIPSNLFFIFIQSTKNGAPNAKY